MTNISIEVRDPPEEEAVEGFQRPLFENPRQHQEAPGIETIIEKNRNKQQIPAVEFTQKGLRKKISQYSNFKAPGIDKIPNFWLKKITSLHHHYALAFYQITKRRRGLPTMANHWKYQPALKDRPDSLAKQIQTHLLPINNIQVADRGHSRCNI